MTDGRTKLDCGTTAIDKLFASDQIGFADAVLLDPHEASTKPVKDFMGCSSLGVAIAAFPARTAPLDIETTRGGDRARGAARA